MTTEELKAQLLQLLKEDPEFRAAVQEVLPPPMSAERVATVATPAPAPAFNGPAWLKDRAAQHGPHSKARFSE